MKQFTLCAQIVAAKRLEVGDVSGCITMEEGRREDACSQDRSVHIIILNFVSTIIFFISRSYWASRQNLFYAQGET